VAIIDPLAPTADPVAQAYANAIASSHEVYIDVEWRPWYAPADEWQPLQDLPGLVVVAGTVNMTRSSLVTRGGSLRLGGWGAVPRADFSGPVSPKNRYRLWRGVRSGGTVHKTLLGTFVASGIRPVRTATGVEVQIDLADEMKLVDLDPLPASLGLAGEVTVKQALRWLLTDLTGYSAAANGGLAEYGEANDSGVYVVKTPRPTFEAIGTGPSKPTPNWITTGPYAVEDEAATLLEDTTFDGSRTSAIESLMDTANVSVFLDEYGEPQVIRRVVNVDSAQWNKDTLETWAAWTFRAGDGGTLTERAPEWSLDSVVNKTHIVSGDFASRKEVTTGPLTPDELGMVLTYFEDVSSEPFSEDLSALRKYADRTSRERLGAARTMRVSSMVVPWVKPGSIVRVADLGPYATEGYELLIVDDVDIPLDYSGAMSMTLRTLDIENFPA
jgi:hypothetical protein